MADSPFRLLIPPTTAQNSATRSDTVIAVSGSEAAVSAVKKAAQQAGIMLGNGYGAWKTNTFRIANFPAITESERSRLRDFLRSYRP